VSVFGGTTPLISQALIDLTGNTYMPAFYIMFLAAVAGIALFPMKETAKRPLLGSVPTVANREDARKLVDGQDTNPHLDLSTMHLPPLDAVPKK
jgi:MFS transporter, MHS family, proline/betaine transporter